MELLMGLICVGLVLAVLLPLFKANPAANDLDNLRLKVQRLEDRLNEMGDQFTDTKPTSPPLGQAERAPETKPKESEIKQAALAKPEPKHFTLPSDLKESREAALAKKDRRRKMASVPPPIIQSPKPVPHVEPAAKPSQPAKPEKVAATAQAGMPR
ncbi:MAG: conotoxin, partial [Verrucomicrobiota bacterium]|nr:conotoxin [Verrucomicrobiota bacterium]